LGADDAVDFILDRLEPGFIVDFPDSRRQPAKRIHQW
jgi:hypothetical protein